MALNIASGDVDGRISMDAQKFRAHPRVNFCGGSGDFEPLGGKPFSDGYWRAS